MFLPNSNRSHKRNHRHHLTKQAAKTVADSPYARSNTDIYATPDQPSASDRGGNAFSWLSGNLGNRVRGRADVSSGRGRLPENAGANEDEDDGRRPRPTRGAGSHGTDWGLGTYGSSLDRYRKR
jgi:hypothetical protein